MNNTMKTLTLFILIALPNALLAQDTPPQLSKLPACQTPVGHSSTERADYNLGATGMRGWIYGAQTTSTASREILVRVVEKGSPADGKFQKFDLIVGVNGKPFTADARESFAKALTESEATGKLNLLRWRNGRTENVTLKIEKLGAYSPTAPYDCPKSNRVIRNSAEYITNHLFPEKRIGMGVPRGLNGLLLLATGDVKYLPQIRRYARDISEEMADITDWKTACSLWTWHYGYKNLFLTEYYLATGDRAVLPAIENICGILARGQGLPGAWCHSLSKKGHIMPGYGAVNNTGIVCFMSMGLADKCGVKVDQRALADSFAFFGSFAGKGAPAYGDHPSWGGNAANGKSGSSAVAFTIMDAPNTAQWFSRLAASSNQYDLYRGHTGNFWNHTWTPIGAFLAGRESFIDFFKRVRSNYDLMRRWDHGACTNPDFSKRECYAATRKYGGPYWGPGAFSLFLTAPRKKLQIFGAPQSVFAKGGCPTSLKKAMQLYQAADYGACLKALGSVEIGKDSQHKLQQLKAAASAAMAANKATLVAIRENMRRGDYHIVMLQLKSLEGLVSLKNSTYVSLQSIEAIQKVQKLAFIGKEYYELAKDYADDHVHFRDEYRVYPKICISTILRNKVKAIAANPEAGAYQKMAKAFLAANPMHRYQRIGHEWLPLSEHSPLQPIFNCAAADAKKTANADVRTVAFAPGAGSALKPLNKSVSVKYTLVESPALREYQTTAGKPVQPTWAASDFPVWSDGALPLGQPDRRAKDETKALAPGMSLVAHITFTVDDPAKYSDWFITCKSAGVTDICLNGTRILVIDGISRWYNTTHLKPESATFFKKGENRMSIKVTVSSSRAAAFLDVGLDALAK